MRISWNKFKQALRAANPRLVLGPGSRNLGAMVYYRQAGHFDAVEGTDLVEMFAIASPSFFQACPAVDFIHQDGAGRSFKIRGYSTFFRLLARFKAHGAAVVNKKRLLAVLPTAFTRFNAKLMKDNVAQLNKQQEPLLKRQAAWLKSRSKPIPGYGMPIGWRPTKIITGAGGSKRSAGGLYV